VFHSKGEIKSVLDDREMVQYPEVKELLEMAANKSLWNDRTQNGQRKNPIIAVEGLDAAGKSTLCENLSQSIPKASLLHTPPRSFLHLRATFDKHPPLLRRAFYSLGNYITALEIKAKLENGPVIVDRFWHSTAAYAIATEVSHGGSENLPPSGDDVFRWPRDLIKPDLALLLVVSPEERLRRIRARGGDLTVEEKMIEKDRQFQERLLESYKRMFDPPLTVVDANGTQQEVLKSVQQLLKEKLQWTVDYLPIK